MFNFKVRSASHADKNAVCRIAASIPGHALTPKELDRIYTEIIEDISQIVMVSVHSGHAAGFIHARHEFDMVYGECIEIVSIAMNPYYQNRGGEAMLLAALEKWSGQMLVPRIVYVLKGEDEAVKALLKSKGYVDNGSSAFEKTIDLLGSFRGSLIV